MAARHIYFLIFILLSHTYSFKVKTTVKISFKYFRVFPLIYFLNQKKCRIFLLTFHAIDKCCQIDPQGEVAMWATGLYLDESMQTS